MIYAVQVEEVTKADYLIAGEGAANAKRTLKLMTAISRGIPVLDIAWLRRSTKAHEPLLPEDFILQPKALEKKYQFR